MNGYQFIKRVFQLGYRYPLQVAWVRVAIGIWLLCLTPAFGPSHGRRGWLLVALAAVNFLLAYRLVRIARKDPNRHVTLH